MRIVSQNHIAEDVLEQFVMAKLSEAEVVPVEEHLLICQRCCERVAWLDGFVGSIRSAARATSHIAGAGRQD
jgi:anti-sigma factor ChrR (cupin superfamily)